MSKPDGSQPDVVALVEKFMVKVKDSHNLRLMIEIATDLDAKYPNVPEGLRMLADDLEREFHKEGQVTDHTPVPEFDLFDEYTGTGPCRWKESNQRDWIIGCKGPRHRYTHNPLSLGWAHCPFCGKPVRVNDRETAGGNGPLDPMEFTTFTQSDREAIRAEVLAEVDKALQRLEAALWANGLWVTRNVQAIRREIAELGREGAARTSPNPAPPEERR